MRQRAIRIHPAHCGGQRLVDHGIGNILIPYQLLYLERRWELELCDIAAGLCLGADKATVLATILCIPRDSQVHETQITTKQHSMVPLQSNSSNSVFGKSASHVGVL